MDIAKVVELVDNTEYLNFRNIEKPDDAWQYEGQSRKQREANIVPVRNSKSDPKIHRNSYCSCGSGLKFKKCCGK